MTDEECIALAMLHGCEFFRFEWGGGFVWYVRDASTSVPKWSHHPVEDAQLKKVSRFYFETREELARAYCKFYNLER
ncbi:hypothetical protein [Bradyrhizobium cenepequi]